MQRTRRLPITLLWLWLMIFPASEAAVAQQPMALRVNPDIREISLDTGPKEIKIHAETDMASPSFFWNLDGPGKLIGEKGGWSISYIPPENLEQGGEVPATISVTVREEGGRTETGQTILMLSDPTPSETAVANARSPSDRDALLSEAVLRPDPEKAGEKAPAPDAEETAPAAPGPPKPAPAPVPENAPEADPERRAESVSPPASERPRRAAAPPPEEKRSEAAAPSRPGHKRPMQLPEKRRTPPPAPDGPEKRLGAFKNRGDKALSENRFEAAEQHYRSYLSLYSGMAPEKVTPRVDVESMEVQDRLVAAINQRLTRQLSLSKERLTADLESYRKLRELENRGTYIAEEMLPLLKRIIAEIEEIEALYEAFPDKNDIVLENLSRARTTRKTFEEELSVRRARGR